MKFLSPIVALLFIAGCTHTEKQKVLDARVMYTTGLHEINVLHTAGIISVEQKRKIAPTTQAIANALDLAESTANGGSDFATDNYLTLAESLFDKVLTDVNIDPKTIKRKK